ncbi:hypothetical protein [Hyalangium rubrum]|uniref:Uncharacterized protein n=1 Tax=Hyalangium rubrum TaxID=3103134 RepID=A0ABU5HFL9_9BACT|nr:hypothetical protein [Hyalangium sp. s54d21]MDY7232248.1 hypothetical protein [Hyalangium sp. s54d21]
MLRQLLLSEFNAEAWGAEGGWALLEAEFPMVAIQPLVSGVGAQVLRLDVEEWRAPGFDPAAWDPRIFSAVDAERLALHLVGARGEELATAALEIVTRYQGLVGRRNPASSGVVFDQLLERHRALHDLSRSGVRARYQHALDTWQWVLRLEPDAELAVQVAALFHGAENSLFDVAPVACGADMARELLAELGVETAKRERAYRLITRHVRAGETETLALLDDADSLSLFSLHSSGFLRHFGVEPAPCQGAIPFTRSSASRRLGQVYLSQRMRPLLEARRQSTSAPNLPCALPIEPV